MSNRRWWNANSDDYQAAHGRRLEETALAWGVWRIAEAELGHKRSNAELLAELQKLG